jgi:hypothetical protein
MNIELNMGQAKCTPNFYYMRSRGEEGALPKECHSLTFFCNSGGYLPYIFL